MLELRSNNENNYGKCSPFVRAKMHECNFGFKKTQFFE